MELRAQRKQRFANIRDSLKTNPAILATGSRLQEKMQRRQRRSSIQIGDKEMPNMNFEETPSDEEDTDSSLFNEKYTMGQKTGQGAHGVVKRCYDRNTGQVYAVKTLTLQYEQLLALKKNFLQVRSLCHPHILTYKSLFFQLKFSRCYLVMDYVPFPDLEMVRIESEHELKLIAYQLLETLKYLHENKICHRDIKPDNILYDLKAQSIKLIDFGISKKVEERGRKRQMLTLTGTPYYRAPQMFMGGGYDQMVDLWAVGITIFKMMTGYTPFQSEYQSDTINNILTKEVVFPQKLKFQCSQYPKILVKWLLKKDKKERFTVQQAMKDIWFTSLKPVDELTRSMTIESMNQSFNPKMSLDIKTKETEENNQIIKEKMMDCFKKFKAVQLQTAQQIFGEDDIQ